MASISLSSGVAVLVAVAVLVGVSLSFFSMLAEACPCPPSVMATPTNATTRPIKTNSSPVSPPDPLIPNHSFHFQAVHEPRDRTQPLAPASQAVARKRRRLQSPLCPRLPAPNRPDCLQQPDLRDPYHHTVATRERRPVDTRRAQQLLPPEEAAFCHVSHWTKQDRPPPHASDGRFRYWLPGTESDQLGVHLTRRHGPGSQPPSLELFDSSGAHQA